MQAFDAYTVGIMSIQYTIRSVPESLDQALRQVAKQEEKSLNAMAVELLARGLGMESEGRVHDDLDGLIGSWEEDPAFEAALEDFGRIDEDAWK